ncbi:MAG: preprotein translocase subunit YajC [Mariniblastus sp.]
MDNLYSICWFMLAQAQGAGTAKTAEDVNNAANQAADGGFFSSPYVLPIMIGVMLLYFLLTTRPQDKAQTRASDLLASLKKNDRVVTAGGILGTVVNFRSDAEFVTIRVDDSSNTRMQVLAKSIIRVLSDEDAKDS